MPSREAQKAKEWHVTVREEVPVAPEEAKKPSYEDLGLKNGDVITAINGTPVESPSFAFTELNRLLNESGSLRELRVMREGQVTRLHFNVADSRSR